MTKQERIEEIESLEGKMYKEKFKYEEKTGDYEKYGHEWYKENIKPLENEMKQLREEIYQEELLSVKIGDGVTIGCWTDRWAYTVIKRTPKTITIQRDKARRIDNNGMSDSQTYEYEANPRGKILTFRWNGKRWKHKCYHLGLGRNEYYDFCF